MCSFAVVEVRPSSEHEVTQPFLLEHEVTQPSLLMSVDRYMSDVDPGRENKGKNTGSALSHGMVLSGASSYVLLS